LIPEIVKVWQPLPYAQPSPKSLGTSLNLRLAAVATGNGIVVAMA